MGFYQLSLVLFKVFYRVGNLTLEVRVAKHKAFPLKCQSKSA